MILDPHGVEVARRMLGAIPGKGEDDINAVLWDLATALKRENPKLGTYTVTIKEVE